MATMKASSALLIDESPLQVLPSLAAAIGLNEAIVLQQVKYWLNLSKNEKNGRKWVYNTVAEWQRQFPFWSEDTVKRTLKSLRDKGLLLTCTITESSWDRTLWYSIDYDKLDEVTSSIGANCTNGESKQQQSIVATCTDGLEHNAPLFIQENTTEITSDDRSARATATLSAKPIEDSQSAAVFKKMQEMGVGLSSYNTGFYGDLIDQFGATAVIRGLTAAANNGKQNRIHYVKACIENAAQGFEPEAATNNRPSKQSLADYNNRSKAEHESRGASTANGRSKQSTSGTRSGYAGDHRSDSPKPWADYQRSEFDEEAAAAINGF